MTNKVKLVRATWLDNTYHGHLETGQAAKWTKANGKDEELLTEFKLINVEIRLLVIYNLYERQYIDSHKPKRQCDLPASHPRERQVLSSCDLADFEMAKFPLFAKQVQIFSK